MNLKTKKRVSLSNAVRGWYFMGFQASFVNIVQFNFQEPGSGIDPCPWKYLTAVNFYEAVKPLYERHWEYKENCSIILKQKGEPVCPKDAAE